MSVVSTKIASALDFQSVDVFVHLGDGLSARPIAHYPAVYVPLLRLWAGFHLKLRVCFLNKFDEFLNTVHLLFGCANIIKELLPLTDGNFGSV